MQEFADDICYQANSIDIWYDMDLAIVEVSGMLLDLERKMEAYADFAAAPFGPTIWTSSSHASITESLPHH